MIDKILWCVILIFLSDSLNLYTRYKLTNKVNPLLKYRNFNFGFSFFLILLLMELYIIFFYNFIFLYSFNIK